MWCVRSTQSARLPGSRGGRLHKEEFRNRKPAGSRVELRRTANTLEIDIPPAGVTGAATWHSLPINSLNRTLTVRHVR